MRACLSVCNLADLGAPMLFAGPVHHPVQVIVLVPGRLRSRGVGEEMMNEFIDCELTLLFFIANQSIASKLIYFFFHEKLNLTVHNI